MTDIVLPATAWDGVEDATEALLDKWLVAPRGDGKKRPGLGIGGFGQSGDGY